MDRGGVHGVSGYAWLVKLMVSMARCLHRAIRWLDEVDACGILDVHVER